MFTEWNTFYFTIITNLKYESFTRVVGVSSPVIIKHNYNKKLDVNKSKYTFKSIFDSIVKHEFLLDSVTAVAKMFCK